MIPIKSWFSGLLGLTSTNQVMSSSVLAYEDIELANREKKQDNEETLLITKLRNNSTLAG